VSELSPDYFNRPVAEVDPEIAEVLRGELEREQRTLEMIASENFVPRAVLECQGSVLTNKYAEGYPGRRYYGGCEWVDISEQLAIDRVKELFGAEHANVQPHSGSQANAAVYHALLSPGETIMGLALAHGGQPLPAGENGHIAIRRPDPVMFLEYWRNPAATAEKFAGEYLLTGDLGRQDEAGYFWFQGRSDDVITSAGYRIGPGEIEDCLMKHPAVALAAAVGVPDPLRTEIVKAFLVLKPGRSGTPELAREIQDFIKTQLAAHEYPRLVEFVDALPMTATGKVMRRELRNRGDRGGAAF